MIVRNGLCFCSAKFDSGAVMVHGMIMVFVHDAREWGLLFFSECVSYEYLVFHCYRFVGAVCERWDYYCDEFQRGYWLCWHLYASAGL